MRSIVLVLSVLSMAGVTYLAMDERLFSNGSNPFGILVFAAAGAVIAWLLLYAVVQFLRKTRWWFVRQYYETAKPFVATLRRKQKTEA